MILHYENCVIVANYLGIYYITFEMLILKIQAPW